MNKDLTLEEITKNRIQRMKDCRLEKGMTISEAALCVGVNHSTYSRWEAGVTNTMKFPHLLKLAQAYNVNPDWLWGYDVPRSVETQEHKEKRDRISAILREIPDSDLDRVYQMIKLMLGKDSSK